MNDCFESVRIIQGYYNRTGIFQMDYLITYKLVCCLTFMSRGLRRQDFGAKFNRAYHNGVPVADILKAINV